jgi:hypothetical protein
MRGDSLPAKTVITDAALVPAGATIQEQVPAPQAGNQHWVCFPHGGLPPYPLPESSEEARQRLYKARGEAIAGDLVAAIEFAVARIRAALKTNPATVRDWLTYRADARSHLAAAAELLGLQLELPPEAHVSRLLTRWLLVGGDCRPAIRQAIDANQSELRRVDAQINALEGAAASASFPERVQVGGHTRLDTFQEIRALVHARFDPLGRGIAEAYLANSTMGSSGIGDHSWPPRGALHLALDQMTKALARRAELVKERTDLETDLAEATNRVSAAMAAAIDLLGGPRKAIEVIHTLRCKGINNEVAGLEHEVKLLDAELEELVSCGLGATDGAQDLEHRKASAHQRWMDARTERVATRRQQSELLIADALAGSEKARAELKYVTATTHPTFAQACADARLDQLLLRRIESWIQ